MLKEGKVSRKADVVTPTIIFLVVYILFFVMLLLFAYRPNLGFYEEAYAKEIALIIDNAQPDMTLKIDMDKFCSVAKACDNKPNSLSLLKMVRIDNTKKEVVVSAKGSKGGYVYSFFSDYKVEEQIESQKPRYLIINIREKA